MTLLMTGIHSEECIIRQFIHCGNIIQFTYINLDSIRYYIPGLCDTVCFSGAIHLYSLLLTVLTTVGTVI